MKKIISFVIFIACATAVQAQVFKSKPAEISFKAFADSAYRYSTQEILFSLKELKNPDNRPTQIFGEPTGGDFTYPTFAVTLATIKQFSSAEKLQDYDLNQWIISYLLADADKSHTFAQLYTAKSLYLINKGKALDKSDLWQKLNEAERAKLIGALDLKRSLDIEKLEPANGRPQNYLAVALLIGAYSFKIGVEKDKKMLFSLADKCINILKSGNGFLDDDKRKQGRYDRYNFEFQRFVYEACQLLDYKKAITELNPIVKKSNAIWWDMLQANSYHSTPYGRSLQCVWDDVFEQCGFFIANPEISPATIADIQALWFNSFRYYVHNQYNGQTHLNRMLEPNRGTYSYSGRNRIWQYSVHTFGKNLEALTEALNCKNFDAQKPYSTQLNLPEVSKLHYFRNKAGEPKSALWIYRSKDLYFILPIVAGTGAFTSDYLPLPYAYPGIEVAVENNEPYLTPSFNISGNDFEMPVSLADSIIFNAAEKTLEVHYHKLKLKDFKNSPSGLSVTAKYELAGNALIIQHKVKVSEPLSFNLWRMVIPTSMPQLDMETGTLQDEFGNYLNISCETDWPSQMSLVANQNGKLSKGAFKAVPLQIQWQAGPYTLSTGREYTIKTTIRAGKFD